MPGRPAGRDAEIARLRRRLEREREARHQAEFLSERGLRELYERKQQLELLHRIATTSNEATTPAAALRIAVAELCRFSGWEVGHAFQVDGSGGERQLYSAGIWHEDDPAALEPFRRATGEFSHGVGLPGRTFQAGRPEWITDFAADDNFPRARAARQCGLRSACSFPVLSGSEVVAILEFFARTTREPDEVLRGVMTQIGLQLGRAIERHRHNESVQRRAEELVVARDAAQSANRAKSDFLANMSHELRTPLNSIIGFSELMMKEAFGPHHVAAYKGYAENIHEAGHHLLGIINDILDLSKIEAGKASLGQEEPLDLAAAIRGVCQTLRVQAEAKGVSLRIDTAPDLPLLFGAERVIRQILMNLLSNALKFTPAGGTVCAATTLGTSGELRLSVSDNGIGMTAEEIAVALAPFGQVENIHTRNHEGTGLGLPLARAMAALHQGEFYITSETGAGTSIEIVFPPARSRFVSEQLRAYA